MTTLHEELRTTTIEHLGASATAADLETYRKTLRAIWPVAPDAELDLDLARMLTTATLEGRALTPREQQRLTTTLAERAEDRAIVAERERVLEVLYAEELEGCPGNPIVATEYRHMGLTGDAAREYRLEDLARACATEAWDVCAADQRADLSGTGAGQEPGTIEALTDLVSGIPHGSRAPTPADWRAFVAAYDQRLKELRGEIES